MKKHLDRQKVNFMMSRELLIQLNQLVPAGERSNFMNEALEEAITRYGRKKASETMDKLAKSGAFSKLSTKEFLKTRHDGLL